MARGKTVSDVGEEGLLKRLARRFAAPSPGVPVSVGDDAAVLCLRRPGVVLTTDTLVEGVDFRFSWASWRDVGCKAAAVNLSDLAAMGATPRALLLSLALRGGDAVRDVMGLVDAFARVGAAHGAPLIGGDLSAIAGPLVVSVTAVGEAHPKGLLRRHRGRPGDLVVVSGTLGASAAGLLALETARRAPGSILSRHLRPSPRTGLGRALAMARCVKSAADLSDGLVRDAPHVVRPGCGVHLDLERLPVSPALRRLCGKNGWSVTELALFGGEDFELVLAVAPKDFERVRRIGLRRGLRMTPVGRVVEQKGVRVFRAGRWRPVVGGFSHFGGQPGPGVRETQGG